MTQKTLIDFSDEELIESLRHEAKDVHYWANNYYEEISRRNQEKHTLALNRWTVVIAIATVVNTIVVIIFQLTRVGE